MKWGTMLPCVMRFSVLALLLTQTKSRKTSFCLLQRIHMARHTFKTQSSFLVESDGFVIWFTKASSCTHVVTWPCQGINWFSWMMILQSEDPWMIASTRFVAVRSHIKWCVCFTLSQYCFLKTFSPNFLTVVTERVVNFQYRAVYLVSCPYLFHIQISSAIFFAQFHFIYASAFSFIWICLSMTFTFNLQSKSSF